MMDDSVADKTRSGSEGGLKPAISFGHFRVFLLQIFVLSLSELDERPKGWGLSAKLGKHCAIWGKLGTALQAYTLNPCTKFPPNPTSRKVNT